MNGRVFLVGAGPGDPGLITIKGLQAIKQADVIIYDRLANPWLLTYAKAEAEEINVGKHPKKHPYPQEKINRLLIKKAREGKTVVRLKGGDPFVFGRGGEEAAVLVSEGIPFEIVPGITSAISVPAYAGIPVTHREYSSSFSVITGHHCVGNDQHSLEQLIDRLGSETIIFLMGVKNLPIITKQLLDQGTDPTTPVALIRSGTTPEQETLVGTLENIAQEAKAKEFGSPAIILVGSVVQLRQSIQWFENKPLFGKRILLTRARNQNQTLADRCIELGGEPYEFPVIRTTSPSPEQKRELDQALNRLSTFDWLVLTSVHGVDLFFSRMMEREMDVRALGQMKIAAVGSQTAAAIQSRGLRVDCVPSRSFHAEGLVDALRPQLQGGEHVLLPRSSLARQVLPVKLSNLGCEVTAVDTYDTVKDAQHAEKVVQLLQDGAIHIITFTSASTVRFFVEAMREVTESLIDLLQGVTIACLGPITAQTARDLGLNVQVIADPYTLDGLMAAILSEVRERKE